MLEQEQDKQKRWPQQKGVSCGWFSSGNGGNAVCARYNNNDGNHKHNDLPRDESNILMQHFLTQLSKIKYIPSLLTDFSESCQCRENWMDWWFLCTADLLINIYWKSPKALHFVYLLINILRVEYFENIVTFTFIDSAINVWDVYI